MGRREAWSAEKPSDTRTKPTRWEFRDGREQSDENIEHAGIDNDNNAMHRSQSAEYQQRRVRIK